MVIMLLVVCKLVLLLCLLLTSVEKWVEFLCDNSDDAELDSIHYNGMLKFDHSWNFSHEWEVHPRVTNICNQLSNRCNYP